MIHTYATTLDEWAATQDQTTDFARAYDKYKQFETELAMVVDIPAYRKDVRMKVYFYQWELDLNGMLYLAFTTRRARDLEYRKEGLLYRRPVGTIKLISYEKPRALRTT